MATSPSATVYRSAYKEILTNVSHENNTCWTKKSIASLWRQTDKTKPKQTIKSSFSASGTDFSNILARKHNCHLTSTQQGK